MRNVVVVALAAVSGVTGMSSSHAQSDSYLLASGAHLGPWVTTVIAADPPAEANAWTANVTRSKLGKPPKVHSLQGVASYYWQDQMTATGERFNKRDMTAAHPTLPFGTKVRVTRPGTDKAVVVRINDRGPFKPGRVIDLSEAAAEQIGMTTMGLAQVSLEVLP